jgi:formate dehydrogenase subunit gamma
MSQTHHPDRPTLVRAIAEQRRRDRGALMPILHEIQDEYGWVDRADVVVVADVLNLSVAEVHGVLSFYHDFRTSPPPTHTVQLCRAEACQAVGAQTLWDDVAADDLGPDVGVEQVFCLGNCALGPSGMLDGRLHGHLSTERLAALTDGWRS